MKYYCRTALLVLTLSILMGCSSYQPTKNVWKTTKGLWNTYVSQAADVDYEDRADLPKEAMTLSRDMQGIDIELTKLERAMQNADKPPTQAWLNQLFDKFPWLNGFAGVKYNGVILGQQPPDSMKELDFNPLLYEDKKQNSRALRADIQPSPLGPEIMLATPLYDGVDFLGIVVAYFDMRSLTSFSENPQDIVILAPTALLWPGKYDFAQTPLAGVNWAKVVTESSAGKCSNATGTFIYIIRYLGNLPLIFAIPEKGEFPESSAGIEQGFAYFPTQREKLPPPDLPERKNANIREDVPFAQPEDEETGDIQLAEAESQTQPSTQQGRPDPNEIQPGSRDSMLLRGGGKGQGRQIQERQLEGENVEVERVQRQRIPARRPTIIIPDEMEEEAPQPLQPIQRPSPFGPAPEQEDRAEEPQEAPRTFTRPSPFGPPPTMDEPPQQTPSNNTESTRTGEDNPVEDSFSTAPAASTPETSAVDDDSGETMADGEKVEDSE